MCYCNNGRVCFEASVGCIKMLRESALQFGWNSVQDRSGVFILTQTSIRAFALVLVLPGACTEER